MEFQRFVLEVPQFGPGSSTRKFHVLELHTPRDPTIDPTANPTSDPTLKPTAEPTASPSTSPTYSPSLSPTRYPTASSDYDSYMEIVYGIRNLEDHMVEMVANDIKVFVTDFIGMIEHSYVSLSTVLEYRHFYVQMIGIGNQKIQTVDGMSETEVRDVISKNYRPMLKFEARIICAEWICGRIIEDYHKGIFEEYITHNLRAYFMVSDANTAVKNGLSFVVVSDESLMKIKSLNPEESPPYVIFAIASISGFLSLIGLFAFIFNKMPDKCSKIPGFNVVDDGKWTSMIIFALQFWYVAFLQII